jgi:PAS domain S-box-containing protein
MLSDVLQEKAVQYVSGGMTAPERENFEILLEFIDELRTNVEELRNVVTAIAVPRLASVAAPPAALKARILSSIATLPPRAEPDALVATDSAGQIHWVSDSFTAMCGYSLAELKGRKPGHILQGPGTDPAAVERIRAALRAGRACRETLVNYHKDGTRYRADVQIAPILDDEEKPLWFVARERKLPEVEAASAR